MNLTRDRLHSIGWAFVLSICAALTAGLALRVNAAKSQVHEAERSIVHLRHEIIFLETEFQTRANQQQLRRLNDLEFGYQAPMAAQYIEGERHLAGLGKPRAPGAPAPIRMASIAGDAPAAPFLPMVSPITGLAGGGDAGRTQVSMATSAPDASRAAGLDGQGGPAADGRDPVGAVIEAADLGARLSRIDLAGADGE